MPHHSRGLPRGTQGGRGQGGSHDCWWVGGQGVTRRTSQPIVWRQKGQEGPIQEPELNKFSFSGFDFQPTGPAEIGETVGERGEVKSCLVSESANLSEDNS